MNKIETWLQTLHDHITAKNTPYFTLSTDLVNFNGRTVRVEARYQKHINRPTLKLLYTDNKQELSSGEYIAFMWGDDGKRRDIVKRLFGIF